jgi:hypothetical protein
MFEKHPAFPLPADTDLQIWRYMDLGRFVWIEDPRLGIAAEVDLGELLDEVRVATGIGDRPGLR